MHEHFEFTQSEHFHRHREECKLSFYPTRRFKFSPSNRNSWNSANLVAEARVANDDELGQGRAIDGQSLQLLVSAFYNNFIYRPLKNLGNFYIITKTIIYDPSSKIEQKYLIP